MYEFKKKKRQQMNLEKKRVSIRIMKICELIGISKHSEIKKKGESSAEGGE